MSIAVLSFQNWQDKNGNEIVIDKNAICYGIIYNHLRISALLENVEIQRFLILYKRCMR